MAAPFIGQISIVAFNFPPKGWAFCNGQVLPINQNQALFSLLGTYYGGNGQTTFALPNLQGKAPVHVGGEIQQGHTDGEQAHTLLISEIPQHSHAAVASGDQATGSTPAGNVLSSKVRRGKNVYGPAPANQALDSRTIAAAGGSQPHNNLQPYLVVNYVIALQGIFPSRN